MTKTYKNIPSLHRLLESAPVESLHLFVAAVDDGKYADCFSDVLWPGDEADEAADDAARHKLLEIAVDLEADVAVPLEAQSQRLLALSESRGVEAIARVSEKIFSTSDESALDDQKDDYGRAIWLYVHQGQLFDEAENLFYADHYRNFGKMYEAFEIDADAKVDFVWDDKIKAELEKKIEERLELKGPCTITHIAIDGKDDRKLHLLIVRHAGPLSSVAEIKDGRKRPIYYRPANEATLLYSPQDGVIEVFADSVGIRPVLASGFAEAGLHHDISGRPLTFKQYNLSRFLSSLQLPVVAVDGFEIDRAAVVEADARPQNLKHRVSLKVTIDDDIDAVANSELGPDNVFRRAAAISRVVIAVRHSRDDDGKKRTLNISLSDPNRCNLRSNRNPNLREFGYALLEQWGIMQQVRALSIEEEISIFPALIEVYDQRGVEISGRFFVERGITQLELLIAGGFITRRGREKSYAVDLDDGQVQLVPVKKSKAPDMHEYQCPKTNLPVLIPSIWMDRFETKSQWIEERVVKGLQKALTLNGKAILEGQLITLGQLSLQGESIPAYLAFGLADDKQRDLLDQMLRARHSAGFGIVFSAGKVCPQFLGPNVVMWAGEHLTSVGDSIQYNFDAIKMAFNQAKVLMAGATTVLLLTSPDKRSLTLIIPGKPAWTVSGFVQMEMLRRLVAAHPHPVATKNLRPHSDETEASPAGPDKVFKRYENWRDYIVMGKKGFWRLNA